MSTKNSLSSLSSTKPLTTYSSFYKEPSNSFRNSSLLNQSFKSTFPKENKVRNQLINLNKTLKTENYSDNGFINRPTITFKPEMPLHNFEKKELINPSKMNFVVSVNPPPCHRVKKEFGNGNYKNKFKKKNESFTFLKPDLKNEIDEYEKGLISSFRRQQNFRQRYYLF